MAQFDVYRNNNRDFNRTTPYLLDIQADLFNHFGSRVVAPLVLSSKVIKIVKHLNPQFKIEDKELVLVISDLATVPVNLLTTRVTSLSDKCSEIIAALDFLFMGF